MRKLRQLRSIMLRMFLIYSAVGWGICVAGIFISGPFAFDLLAYIGGVNTSALCADPMYDYWLRMASSVFAFIGVAYLVLAIYPKRFASVLPFSGIFMILEGVILMIHGLRLNLPSTPFWGDVSFCFLGGIGILLCMSSAKKIKKNF